MGILNYIKIDGEGSVDVNSNRGAKNKKKNNYYKLKTEVSKNLKFNSNQDSEGS